MGNSSSLRKAIREDDAVTVEAILKSAGPGSPDLINEDFTGDCLCQRGTNIQSPLHTCVAKRKFPLTKLLILYGADVTTGGRDGMTPLHYAAKNGDLPACRLLVAHGGRADVEDHSGQLPVHAAAASVVANGEGRTDVLQYLLDEAGRPEDVNALDVDGCTPLHVAAWWGYAALAAYLLQRGVDANVKNTRGKTALEDARARGKESVVQLLTEHTTG